MTTTLAKSRTVQPLLIEAGDNEPVTETFVEIIDIRSGRRVVSVVEVLSPTNKRSGTGKDLYLKKQRELLDGHVSVVEIDLLRHGQWVLSIPLRRIPRERRTPYRIMVRRGWKLFPAEYYSAPMREPLPTIKVPLREKDADAALDLQALIDQVYTNGAYENDVDYEIEPNPPFDAEDAAWADALLQAKGVRKQPKNTTSRKRKK